MEKKEQLIHPSQPFFYAVHPVADASSGHLAGGTSYRADDLALGHHDDEEGDEREKAEGADDVDGVWDRGLVIPPANNAGQPGRFQDVLAPAQQREAGPDCSHQPDEAACFLHVGSFCPHSCKQRLTLRRLHPQVALLWSFLHISEPNVLVEHTCPPDLTVKGVVADLQVAEAADGGDGEHAAQAEDMVSETVVGAGGAASLPGMLEVGGDGDRVEQDAAGEVSQSQVDVQHHGGTHPFPGPLVG